MELRLYDTLTREKRPFVPLDKNRVRMYVCGPTVYDFAHIGNARPVIVFDVLYRLLRHLYGAEHVTYVRNITDVDDKINARAGEEYPNLPLKRANRLVTGVTKAQFHRDVAALGCLPPTVEPRATEHIAEMKTLIKRLIDSGHAYVAEDHVLFSVPSMPDYGKLAKRSLEEMKAGARVEVAPYKRDPTDFVLWKPSKPGEPAWLSPAGIKRRGRPGWHIECSAMSWKHLGEVFDIHGGGIDLVFPHHENEIAQSRCAFHTPVMANYWMHNGFLQVEGRKMAKSEGNFVTIHELLRTANFGGRKWRGEVLRLAMLQTHYRQPIDWTVRNLEQSETRLNRWKEFAAQRTTRKSNPELRSAFFAALCDDLNTPVALSVIDQACNKEAPDERDRYTVSQLLKHLGFRRKKSSAARLVDTIDPFLNRLAALSVDHWRQLFQNAHSSRSEAPEVKLFASVNAMNGVRQFIQSYLRENLESNYLDTYWSKITNLISPFKDEDARYSYVHRFLDAQHERRFADHKAARLFAESLLKDLNPALKVLSSLTVNDWKNLAESVRRRPTFASGEPKPETRVFAYLLALAWLQQQLSHVISQLGHVRKIDELRGQISEMIAPKVDKLEQRIAKLIDARNTARSARNFAEADRIRNELKAMGVELEDKKDGTTVWRMKS